jgi:hypothetical protein
VVGVQALRDGARRQCQGPPPRGGLDRLEVEPVTCARAYERLDLLDELRREGFLEAPFFAASAPAAAASSSASAQLSQARQYCSSCSRNPAALATWVRTNCAWADVRKRERVVCSTPRVSTK